MATFWKPDSSSHDAHGSYPKVRYAATNACKVTSRGIPLRPIAISEFIRPPELIYRLSGPSNAVVIRRWRAGDFEPAFEVRKIGENEKSIKKSHFLKPIQANP